MACFLLTLVVREMRRVVRDLSTLRIDLAVAQENFAPTLDRLEFLLMEEVEEQFGKDVGVSH